MVSEGKCLAGVPSRATVSGHITASILQAMLHAGIPSLASHAPSGISWCEGPGGQVARLCRGTVLSRLSSRALNWY